MPTGLLLSSHLPLTDAAQSFTSKKNFRHAPGSYKFPSKSVLRHQWAQPISLPLHCIVIADVQIWTGDRACHVGSWRTSLEVVYICRTRFAYKRHLP